MNCSFPLQRLRILFCLGVVVLAACGGGDPLAPPPVAQALAVEGVEDQPVTLQLAGTDEKKRALLYRLAVAPLHGTVVLSPDTGEAIYTPQQDFNGIDRFSYVVATASGSRSAPAEVQLNIAAVNDQPTIVVPDSATNSAYSYESPIDLVITDVDGDATSFDATIEPADVATLVLDRENSRLVLLPLRRGAATIRLEASDGTLTSTATIAFSVTDVRRFQALEIAETDAKAIKIRNPTDVEQSFRLEHNGFQSFASLAEVAEHVDGLPPVYAEESFGSKLWRFVRDNVAHDYPLSQEQWVYAPLVTLNSIGWGLCSNVASLYVRIARAAGYEARVWGLGGHVVPEIFEDGRWKMFDPDLSVFYFNRDMNIASVSELAGDPTLIRVPSNPVHDLNAYNLPYNDVVQGIYASQADNAPTDWYDGPDLVLDGTIRLPPGAALTYPGAWHEAPVGYDGGKAFAVSNYRHAVLDLPEDFRGDVNLPWLLVAVQGQGRVVLDGVPYTIGDPLLSRALVRSVSRRLNVVDTAGELRLVFLVNSMHYNITPRTDVAVTGLDVWALDIGTVDLAMANRAPVTVAPPLVKPKSLLEI